MMNQSFDGTDYYKSKTEDLIC